MKKIFLCLAVCSLIFITGCKKDSEKNVLKKVVNKVENTKSYQLKGELEIINNEDSYLYDVNVSYLKKDYYKVTLKNQINNHEQIILRNDEGVYVLTPSLNKSFKFQSEWPYNNSQVYLLQTVIKDIKNDNKKTFEKTEDNYIFTSKVNYSNNKSLTKQKVYVNKKMEITKIEILNKDEKVQMKMTFKTSDYKITLDKKHFALKENMASTIEENTTPVSKIESILYPMYMPGNAKLKSQNKISVTNGERVILTFSGDSEFMMIQETIKVEDELTVQPTEGEVVLIPSSVATLTEDTITWIANGIEHHVISKNLTQDQLIEVAKSIGNLPVGK